jgi:4-methyl-5(b-hydroxyethyl)-thiazole monophosphate biosynthesis
VTKTVLIPLADGCEELEAVTLIDLLRRADITVVTAAIQHRTIIGSRGTPLIADSLLKDVMDKDFDMVVLPGGLPGATHLNDAPLVHTILKRTYQNGYAVAAICAAPLVLANAGLLASKAATCYPGTLKSSDGPNLTLSDDAVVIDGRVLTSRGPGTAMDFALAIIAYLTDAQTRNDVELALMR